MFDFLFAPALIFAITFAQGSDISETTLSFEQDALVCLRAPYEPCQTDKCATINEGQLALDIQTDTSAKTIIFSREIPDPDSGRIRTAQLIGECAQVSPRSAVRFQKSDQRRYSVFLKLANRTPL